MHGSNFLELRPDNIFAPYTLCKHFDYAATFSTYIYARSSGGFSSLGLLFLVYGFSRRMAWDGSCGEFAQDSVTIYFMAHTLVASRMRVLRLPKRRKLQNSWRVKQSNLFFFYLTRSSILKLFFLLRY